MLKRQSVSHSYSGAIWLALAALAANREVVVARAEVGDVDGVDSLHKLATAANVALKEVGATNRTSIADYEAVLSPQTAAILKLSNDSYRVVGEIVATQLDDIVPLARDRELTPIDSLGMAPLIDLPAQINWPRRSAQASIAAGADLVILRGDALVGGPACGLLLGRSDLIRRVKEHPLFSACQIEPLRAAALTATLACYENQPPGAEAIPVWQCLRISVDNLRNRADRMAAQLSHVEGLSSAAAVETQSPVSAALAQEWPSYGVAITPADGNLPALNDRLLASRIPIRGRVEADRIILDLRTVLPRQDKTIVDSLLGSN